MCIYIYTYIHLYTSNITIPVADHNQRVDRHVDKVEVHVQLEQSICMYIYTYIYVRTCYRPRPEGWSPCRQSWGPCRAGTEQTGNWLALPAAPLALLRTHIAYWGIHAGKCVGNLVKAGRYWTLKSCSASLYYMHTESTTTSEIYTGLHTIRHCSVSSTVE
jgi:hypothetical protein